MFNCNLNCTLVYFNCINLKNFKQLISCLAICIALLTGCNVEKRIHKKGYHITWNTPHILNQRQNLPFKPASTSNLPQLVEVEEMQDLQIQTENIHLHSTPMICPVDTTLLPPRSAKKRARQANQVNETKSLPKRMQVFEGLIDDENKQAFIMGKRIIRAGNYIRISVLGLIGSFIGAFASLVYFHPIFLTTFSIGIFVFFIMTLLVNLVGRIGEDYGNQFIQIFESNHKNSRFYKRVYRHYQSCLNGFFRGLCDFLWFIG